VAYLKIWKRKLKVRRNENLKFKIENQCTYKYLVLTCPLKKI
jgi:hypothetical protein